MASVSGGRSRQRSHSYYSPEDCKNYGVQVQKEETCLRPRSRFVLTVGMQTCACDPTFLSVSVYITYMV